MGEDRYTLLTKEDMKLLKDASYPLERQTILDLFFTESDPVRPKEIAAVKALGEAFHYHGTDYPYRSASFLSHLSDREYVGVFNHVMEHLGSIPEPLNWEQIARLVTRVGVVTYKVLLHCVFWMDDTFTKMPGAASKALAIFTWPDKIISSVLKHTAMSPATQREAAISYVQRVFDLVFQSQDKWNEDSLKVFVSRVCLASLPHSSLTCGRSWTPRRHSRAPRRAFRIKPSSTRSALNTIFGMSKSPSCGRWRGPGLWGGWNGTTPRTAM